MGGYRSATPNKKGQYSAQVLEELESQNEERVEGLSAKVRMLKDVSFALRGGQREYAFGMRLSAVRIGSGRILIRIDTSIMNLG